MLCVCVCVCVCVAGLKIVIKSPTGSKNGDPVDRFITFFSLTPIPLIPLITSDLFFANSDPVDPVDHF